MLSPKRRRRLFLEILENRLNPSTPALMTTITLPGADAPWDYSNGPFNASTLIVNLDGDGQQEVIAPGGDGNLYAYKYNASNHSMYLEREFYCGQWAALIHATPLLVNLPSGPAVFAANINGIVFGWNARTGAILPGWPQSVAYSGSSSPDNAVFGSMAAGDLDGNGVPEIVVPSFNGEVTAFHADGSVMWRCSNDDTIFSGVAIGDINRTGRLSVVVGGDSSASQFAWAGGRVVALSWDGRREWEKATNQVIWSSPVLADLQGNGYLDTIVGTGAYYPPNHSAPYPGNEVLALDQNGNDLPGWPYVTGPTSVDARVLGSPAIADLTGNGSNDVIVNDFSGDVFAIKPNGQLLWSAHPLSGAGGIYSSPIVADITGNGVPDVIVESPTGVNNNSTLAGLDGRTGAPVWFYAGNTGNPLHPHLSAAAVGQLKGDGTWQFGIVANDLSSSGQLLGPSFLELFNLGTSSLTPPWGQFRQDAYARVITGSVSYDTNLIDLLYQGALGRSPSQNELNNIWLPVFERAQELQPDMSGIVASREARTLQIDTWYSSYLGRAADQAGLVTWLSALAHGDSYAVVKEDIIGSAEAFQLAGGTNQGWVTYLYQKVLGRTPSGSEASGWVNALNAGRMTRPQVAAGFFLSREYTSNLVAQFYSTYRPGGLATAPADDLEAAGWDLRRGRTEEYVLTNILVGNGDYLSTQQEGSWIRAIYRQVLQRTAAASDGAYWLKQMENGATYGSIAEAIVRSYEYNTELIQGYYQTFLGRAPSSSEQSYWVTQLNSGMARSNVVNDIVESDEFFAKAGRTVNGFINYAFVDLLGHLPNSSQASYWLNQASSGANIRATLPQTILFAAPSEYNQRLISTWFFWYLGRYPNTPPDQSVLIPPNSAFAAQEFLNDLNGGANPADIQATILISPEYLDLALCKAYWLGARWPSP
jgi:hypothetical protein